MDKIVYFSSTTETAKEVIEKIHKNLKQQIAKDKQAVPKHYNEERRNSFLQNIKGFENSVFSITMQAKKMLATHDLSNILNLFIGEPVVIQDMDGVYEIVDGSWQKRRTNNYDISRT